MADSTTNLDQLAASQSSKEVRINELLDAASPATIYGRRASTSSGLTWGYYGGRWGGTSVSNGTVALTQSTTNYVVAARSTGTVSAATTTTNWNNLGSYARLYKIVAGASSVTSYEDHRGGVGGSSTGPSSVGIHAVPIMAASMQPSNTGGCAPLAITATSSDRPDIHALAFDATTQEYAQFSIPMPSSWDEGTITARFVWSHAATATNFGVVWGLQAVAVGNDDTISVAYGTGQTAADTGGTTDDLYVSPDTSAITVAGTPAAGDVVFFRIYREVANGSDTMTIDARLLSVVLLITTNEGVDS